MVTDESNTITRCVGEGDARRPPASTRSTRRVGRAQQRKPEDVGRTVQTGGDIGRTQRRERRMTKKFSLGAVPRPATVADRIVKPFGSRIDAVVMGGKLKIDVRIATAKNPPAARIKPRWQNVPTTPIFSFSCARWLAKRSSIPLYDRTNHSAPAVNFRPR